MSSVVANPEDAQYEQQAKTLAKSIEWVLKKEKFSVKYPQVIRNSLIAAPGFIYIDYDINGDRGNGRIGIEIVPWQQVRLDGNVSLLEDSEKNQIDLYKRKNWLKVRYPKYAEEIDKMKAKDGGKDDDSQRGLETQDIGGRHKRRRPQRHMAEDILKLQITYTKDATLEAIPDEVTMAELEKERETLKEGEGADVNIYQNHEAHMEDHFQMAAQLKAVVELPPEATFEQVEQVVNQLMEENPEAKELAEGLMLLKIIENHIEEHVTLQKENPKGGRLKYPGGWRVLESIQDKVLYDGASRYEHNEFPVVPFYCYKDNSIYGFSEMRNLVDPQRMQAVMEYKEYKGLQKVANPSVAVFKDSGLTKDDVTNEDGAIWEINMGSKPPTHIQPGQVSEQVSRFSQKKSDKMRDISGVNEATQGKMPSPNASGVSLERIQTQAIGRIRLKDRLNEHYSVKRMGTLIASNIVQFWTTERVLKLEDTPEGKQQLMFNPLEMEDLEYEIEIAPGSMAGVDKGAYNTMLLGLMNSQQITLEQFLEVAEIPKTDKLKELVSTEKQKAEQMQALQMENLQLKSQLAPESLSDEELELLESSNEGAN